MKNRNKQKGFSITELLIIMGIATILAALGVPSYIGARNKYVINSEVDKLTGYIRDGIDRARVQQDGLDWGISINNGSQDWYELLQGGVGGTSTNRVYLDSLLSFTASTTSTSTTFNKGPVINILNASLTIGLITDNGQFTDTIVVDTLGRITRTKNYE